MSCHHVFHEEFAGGCRGKGATRVSFYPFAGIVNTDDDELVAVGMEGGIGPTESKPTLSHNSLGGSRRSRWQSSGWLQNKVLRRKHVSQVFRRVCTWL